MPISLQNKLQLAKTDPHLISTVFGSDVVPEDSYLWEKFGNDYDRYFEMLQDPQVAGKLGERVGALLGRDVLVNPTGKSRKSRQSAAIAQRILDKNLIPYEQICSDFLYSGLLIGFSVLAVTAYEHRDEEDDLILPSLEFVPQYRFIFKEHDPSDKSVLICTDEKLDPAKDIVLVRGYELRLLTRRSPINGERCPKERFFVYTYGAIQGKPMGYGLGARIRKFYEIRHECLRSGVLTGDRLGSPPIHGTYPDDLDPTRNPDHALLLSTFQRLLKAISPNAAAATTAGFEINFLESNTSGHEILKWLYDTSTAEIANAIWGDRSYAEKPTGSYAAQSAQNESRNENVTDSDCNNLDEQLGAQLWKWIGEKNYPGASFPHVRRETSAERRTLQQQSEEEDLRGKRITNDRTLIVDFGLQISNEDIKKRYGEEFSLPESEPSLTGSGGDVTGGEVQPTDQPVDQPVEDAGANPVTADGIPELSEPAYAEGRYSHINFTPPESVQQAAKRGLELRAKQSPSNRGGLSIKEASEQGIGSGVARARDLANGKNLSPDTVRRMLSYFQRHEKDKQSKDWNNRTNPSKGRQAWDLWGGDAGYAWSKKVCAQMDAADEKADHAEAEPKLSEDDRLLDEYEQRLTAQLTKAYGKSLGTIQSFIEGIASSDGSEAEKYRRAMDGIYDLYSEMDPATIATVLGDGLSAGYLAGMWSERVDRDS